MSFRGQLYWDDQLGLVAIDENAQDPTNPQPSEIEPVPFDQIAGDPQNNQLDVVDDTDHNGNDVINVGTLDTDKALSGYNASVEGPITFPNVDFPTRVVEPARVGSMAVAAPDSSWGKHTFLGWGGEFWQTTAYGDIELKQSSVAGELPQAIVQEPRLGDYLVIQDDGSTYVARQYSNSSDMSATTNATAEHTNVIAPRPYSLLPIDTDSKRGWAWAEYFTGEDSRTDIHVRFIDESGGTMSNWLTLKTRNAANPDVRHFHTIDHDIWNPGTLFVTTGDSGDENRWYRTQDTGSTWSLLASESAFKALRLCFGPNYVYWGTDAFVTEDGSGGYTQQDGTNGGEGKMFRVARSDIDTSLDSTKIEEIGTPAHPNSQFIYGACYLEEPHGVIFGTRSVQTRGDAADGPAQGSLHFWDIEREEMRRIHTFEGVDGESAGVSDVAPFRDMGRGKVFVHLTGYDNLRIDTGAGGGGADRRKRQTFAVDIPKMMS